MLMIDKMLTRDVLKHLIPLYIDDLLTLRAYVKVIGISRQAIEEWKRKYVTRITDVNDKYTVRYDTLPGNILHGYFSYQCTQVKVEGKYRGGLPIDEFTISKPDSDRPYKRVTYVDGVKSLVTKYLYTYRHETTYINGKKSCFVCVNIVDNNGITLTTRYYDGYMVVKCVHKNGYVIASVKSDVTYRFMFDDGKLDDVTIDNVTVDEDKRNELYERYRASINYQHS
jgi:hypothetical protein